MHLNICMLKFECLLPVKFLVSEFVHVKTTQKRWCVFLSLFGLKLNFSKWALAESRSKKMFRTIVLRKFLMISSVLGFRMMYSLWPLVDFFPYVLCAKKTLNGRSCITQALLLMEQLLWFHLYALKLCFTHPTSFPHLLRPPAFNDVFICAYQQSDLGTKTFF